MKNKDAVKQTHNQTPDHRLALGPGDRIRVVIHDDANYFVRIILRFALPIDLFARSTHTKPVREILPII